MDNKRVAAAPKVSAGGQPSTCACCAPKARMYVPSRSDGLSVFFGFGFGVVCHRHLIWNGIKARVLSYGGVWRGSSRSPQHKVSTAHLPLNPARECYCMYID